MTARISIAIAALLMLASCSKDTQVTPPTPTPSSLALLCDVTGLTVVGQQGHCTARVTLSNSATQDQPAGVQWSSSDPTKVSVSSSGVITAVAPGSAEIRALYSGLSGNQVIGVNVACAFSVSPTTVSFASGGGTQNVTLTAAPDACSPSTWTASSSTAALTVLPDSGSGSATISLAAAANTGPAQTWTAMIAGQTVTTTIAAAPPPNPGRVLTLTLTQGEHLSGPYGGTVTGPNGFTCALKQTEQSHACPSAQFSDGQTITLQVALTPNIAGDKAIWTTVGCDAATRSTCTLTMTRDRSVTISIGCSTC